MTRSKRLKPTKVYFQDDNVFFYMDDTDNNKPAFMDHPNAEGIVLRDYKRLCKGMIRKRWHQRLNVPKNRIIETYEKDELGNDVRKVHKVYDAAYSVSPDAGVDMKILMSRLENYERMVNHLENTLAIKQEELTGLDNEPLAHKQQIITADRQAEIRKRAAIEGVIEAVTAARRGLQ
ncbi:MAG: hypothetical protein ABIG95_03885 [Candidatus Woesearchaeota archaeon]